MKSLPELYPLTCIPCVYRFMHNMSRVAGKRNMMTANAALINPTPSSDFPLLDALDKATRSKLGQRDIKLLKCDFTLPFSFRTATGGARAQQYSKLDPPPSVYAAEPDWVQVIVPYQIGGRWVLISKGVKSLNLSIFPTKKS